MLQICDKAICKPLYSIFSSYIYIYTHTKRYKQNKENDLISSNQSGFKQEDSCTNQLLSKFINLDQGYEVPCMFLDISKAFDKVWHKGLIHKLEQNGISRPLLKF